MNGALDSFASALVAAIANFHFLRPLWLLGLVPLAATAWLLLRQRLSTGRWRDAVDPELAAWLIESGWRGNARKGLIAILLALALAVIALGGPTWERRPQPVSRGADALVIALDLSLSMYAEDLSPSRLVRARLKISDILADRKDGQTALIVYAGDAHTVVPLTDDTHTINNLLPSLEPSLMPIMGSHPELAIEQAKALLDAADAPSGRILLLTDEIQDPAPAITAAGPYPVSVLGLGTADGGPIPLAPLGRSGTLSADGHTVIATLEPGPLKQLAAATGGRYATFTASDGDLRTVLGERAPDGSRADDTRDREFDLWIDAGPWLLLLVLPVALMMFRRGVIATLALACLLPMHDARADGIADWFERPDQQAYDLLRSGDPAAAAKTFQDPEWRATAHYRARDYEEAANGFSDATSDDLYNRGTALARAQKLKAAQAAFAAALEKDPDNADAKHNKEIVDRLLEQQEEKSKDEQSDQSSDPKGNSDQDSKESKRNKDKSGKQDQNKSGKDSDAGKGQPSDTEQKQARGKQSEEKDKQAQQSKDDALMAQKSREKQQALEQWLRRVPDQPGALLQRKFRYESDKRYRQGLSRAPEDTQPW